MLQSWGLKESDMTEQLNNPTFCDLMAVAACMVLVCETWPLLFEGLRRQRAVVSWAPGSLCDDG